MSLAAHGENISIKSRQFQMIDWQGYIAKATAMWPIATKFEVILGELEKLSLLIFSSSGTIVAKSQ